MAWQDRLLDWFAGGTLAVDRFGRLTQLQDKARVIRFEGDAAGEGDRYVLWFSINYDVQQTQRMAAAGDPIYDMAVDLRLLYCLAEVWTGYFAARRLPWRGEKEAIRLLAELDPAFLKAFQEALGEPQRGRKVQRYKELAAAAVAPLGALWESGSTAFQFYKAPWQAGCDRVAREYWEDLVREPTASETG